MMPASTARTKEAKEDPTHLDHVDILRGLAILMVIMVHTAQRVPGLPFISRTLAEYGQMGVQLFFVASAFTLCLNFVRRRGESLPIKSFYLRRFFRIAPLYYLAIAFYYFIATVRDGGSGHSNMPLINYSALNITLNVGFLHSLYPPANNTIVPGGWSIATEMMFYAAFPLLFPFSRRVFQKSKAAFGIIYFATFVLAVTWQIGALCLWDTLTLKNSFVYFSPVAQLPAFMTGIAIYLFTESSKREKTTAHARNWLGFFVFSSAALLLWNSPSRFSFAIIPTLSAISFAFVFVELAILRPNIRWLASIGKASYSMYILHFAVVWGMNKYLSGVRDRLGIASSLTLLIYFIVATTITYGLAKASDRFVERPGISLGSRIIKRLQQTRGSRTPQEAL